MGKRRRPNNYIARETMRKQGEIIPSMFVWLLRHLANPEDALSLVGDVEEDYKDICSQRGKFRAKSWVWHQVLISLLPFFKSYIYWSFTMIKNYLKIAFRNIKRQKGYSFINIAGLSLGLTCSILILLWIKDELSYDRFHENSDEICSVLIQYNNKGKYQKFTQGALPIALKEEIPEILNSTKLSPLWPLDKNPIKYEDKSFVMIGGVADTSFFDIFTFPFVKGDSQTALS